MSEGRITEVIGAVVDVEFPKDNIPKVYDALYIKDKNLVLEVQQQLGDGIVRAIAMGVSEGLARNLLVKKYWQTYYCSCWKRNFRTPYECFRPSY